MPTLFVLQSVVPVQSAPDSRRVVKVSAGRPGSDACKRLVRPRPTRLHLRRRRKCLSESHDTERMLGELGTALLVGLALAFYVIAGYHTILIFLGLRMTRGGPERFDKRSLRNPVDLPSVSIVIPARDEESHRGRAPVRRSVAIPERPARSTLGRRRIPRCHADDWRANGGRPPERTVS